MRTSLALAALLASFPTLALAGACPAEHARADGPMEGPTEAVGITVENGASVGLAEATGLSGVLQHRVVTIAPGGTLPLHAHDRVPGYAYVLMGSAIERRSDCAVPIRHHPGAVATEPHTLTHWWENDGEAPFVLLVSHVVPEGAR